MMSVHLQDLVYKAGTNHRAQRLDLSDFETVDLFFCKVGDLGYSIVADADCSAELLVVITRADQAYQTLRL